MPPSDGAQPPRGSPPGRADVAALYQELILDHYRRPRNRGRLDHPDVTLRKKNPLCGDVVELALRFEGDTVREVAFIGEGCAISQASASMLTQLIKGKPVAQAAQLLERFTRLVHGDEAAATDPSLGDLRALAGVSRLPVRHPCALLGWTALAEALATRG